MTQDSGCQDNSVRDFSQSPSELSSNKEVGELEVNEEDFSDTYGSESDGGRLTSTPKRKRHRGFFLYNRVGRGLEVARTGRGYWDYRWGIVL